MNSPRRRFFADITPLRESMQLRYLITGESVSLIGRQLTAVAAPIQVFEMTESTLAVGLLGLLQFPALLAGSLIGGAVADGFDRRRVLLVTQLALAANTTGLAFNADSSEPMLWLVYFFASSSALLSGIDYPARTSSIPRLVTVPMLPATYALRVLVFQTANAVGPALAGVVIAESSVGSAYWVDTMTYIISLSMIISMKPIPPHQGGTKPSWKTMSEGLSFIKREHALQGVFLIDIVAMVFGMPRALFPEMGVSVFGGGARTTGLLFAAPGAGAMLASVTSGWVGRVREAGQATVAAVILWGAGIVAFGFTSTLWLALTFLVLAGAGDAISSVFRQTILQTTTPDQLRGRVSAVQNAVVAGGPRIGDAEAGLVASLFGVHAAAWSGGLLSIVGALIVGKLLPTFRDWTPPSHAEHGSE